MTRLCLLCWFAAVACGPADRDDDGFLSDVDCDDRDPEISPEGVEMCDGVDNDCDALCPDVGCMGVDEPEALDAPVWFIDSDGDGYGDPDLFAKACEEPIGWVSEGNDCDDDDDSLNEDCG